MLASPSRRHHPQQLSHASAIPSPCSPQHLPYHQAPQHIATHQYYDNKLLNDYLDSQQSSYNTSTVNIASHPYMTASYTDFANPAIRVQQSTPTPQLQSSAFPQTPMSNSAWNPYVSMQSQSLQTPVQHQSKGHQRMSSSSSTGSNTYQSFPNHLPTPTQTPTHDSFMGQSGYNNSYGPNSINMDNTMTAHMGIKEALMDGEDVPEFEHSARQSVSSYGHDSPATPRTTHGDDLDAKPPVTEARQITIPKFERTYTDIAADTFYDPNAVAAQPQTESKPCRSSLLSPYRSNGNEPMQRALQAAQYARSHSPTSQASRGTSPFRRGSPYHQPSSNFNSPIVGTASAAREQSRQADAAYAMKSQTQPSGSQPETISPKDALLDYREADEDSKVPLFSDSGATEYDSQYNGGDQYRNATQPSFDTASTQSFRRDSWATPQFSPNFPSSSAQSIPASQNFSFITPSNIPSLPLATTSQYRVAPNNMSTAVDQTPEFPAHLTSMESSASEAEPPNGSQSSVNERFLHKPASSNADTGTYSCTYHGCSQRFETPQKLQKHKREGHRNANIGPSMTSEAILERNTQAGPHKCERINPTTGKPCNTIFSRPYDLTRHEDTIHNARKQKVRCALCTEEKTFSRNDALTRHMRVVHPEIDFPGKHRRRGGNHD